MARARKVDVIQVKLNLSALTINGRVTLSSVVAQAAPTSGLYVSNPLVKDTTDKAIQSGVELNAAAADVASAEMKLAASRAALAAAAVQFDKDMLCLKSIAETHCKTEEELNKLGFNRRPPKASPAPLTAPASIAAKPGKEKGSMVVHAARVGRVQSYAAEISADPIAPGTWQPLPGSGVRRTLTGYVSGARYWVRFRAVRAAEESAWSDAAPVMAR